MSQHVLDGTNNLLVSGSSSPFLIHGVVSGVGRGDDESSLIGVMCSDACRDVNADCRLNIFSLSEVLILALVATQDENDDTLHLDIGRS